MQSHRAGRIEGKAEVAITPTKLKTGTMTGDAMST